MSVTCGLITLYICVCMEYLGMLLCVKGVRPRPPTCGKGGELKRINQQVKGVRLRPLTCGKGGELKQINQQVKGVRPMLLTCGKGDELKRINQQVKGVRPRPLLVVRVGNLNE